MADLAQRVTQNGVGTRQANLITPQVLGAYLDIKLVDAIKLTPLMDIDRTLQGRAGDTITLPYYKYIGMADGLDEAETMAVRKIEASTVDKKIGKIGVAVELSDEAIMNHYGDVVNEVGKQLLVSIADKVEADCFAELRTAQVVHTYTDFGKEAILDAQLKFGEDLDGAMVLLVNPAEFNILRKDQDFVHIEGGQRIVSGHFGRVFGVDIIVANRVQAGEAFLMKPGALSLLMKENCQCEQDRNILNMTNVYTAHEFYVPYLKYQDRVVKLSK